MRNFKRNCQTVTFCEYLEPQEILDEDGLGTGSYEKPYGQKQTAQVSVSANKSNTELTMFGTLEDYDRVMTTADTDCPITEHSVLWIGISSDSPHNFVVRKRAESFNGVSYAIKQVTVSE